MLRLRNVLLLISGVILFSTSTLFTKANATTNLTATNRNGTCYRALVDWGCEYPTNDNNYSALDSVRNISGSCAYFRIINSSTGQVSTNYLCPGYTAYNPWRYELFTNVRVRVNVVNTYWSTSFRLIGSGSIN